MKPIQIKLPNTPSQHQLPSVVPIPSESQVIHLVNSPSLTNGDTPLIIDPFTAKIHLGEHEFKARTFKACKHALPNQITIHSSTTHLTISRSPNSEYSFTDLLGQLTLFSLSPPGYILLRPVSAGITSSVFTARQVSSQSLVAVRLTRASDLRYLILTKEAALKAITIPSRHVQKHEHIHSFQHALWHRNNLYAVSDYANGASLSNFLQSGADFNLSELILIMKNILSGLAHLHEYNLSHGNLTVNNILLFLDEKDSDHVLNAKITGFTHARSVDRDEQSYPPLHKKCRYVVGGKLTPPEGSSSKYATLEADMWAAGLILKHMLSILEEDNEDDQDMEEINDLLAELLEPESCNRLTAQAALNHHALSKEYDFDIILPLI